MKTLRPMLAMVQRLRAAACLSGLLGLAQFAHAAPPPPPTEQDKADVTAILHASQAGVPMQLDMRNPLHYRFFMRQMAAAGLTPERYPQMFKLTEAARTRRPPAIETRALSQLNAAHPAANAANGDGFAVVPIQILTSLGSTDGTNYSVSALSSVASPYYSTLTVGVFDNNGNPLGTSVTVSSATQPATDLNAVAVGRSATNNAPVVGMAVYFYQDQYGHAVHGTVQGLVTSAPTSITNQAPMPGPGQTITKLCLGRTGSDCTYTPTGGSGSNVIMPLKGSISFSQPISTVAGSQSALITMARPQVGQGNGCTIASTQTFFGDPNTKINNPSGTISWDVANMQFTSASGCLAANATAIYTLTLGLTVGSQPTFVTITSDPTTSPTDPYFKKIPELQVWFSCVAEGTLVTLEGGKRVKIEDVTTGQRVVVDAQGHTEPVEGKLRGREVRPIVELETAGHRHLQVTDGHPVITDQGPRLAGDLQAGDVVMTDSGPDKLAKVSRQKFAGYVWNLSVGTPPASLSDPAVTGATFVAGGILVGDNVMQFVENRKDSINHAKRAMRTAPPEWRRDIQSAIEDAAQQNR